MPRSVTARSAVAALVALALLGCKEEPKDKEVVHLGYRFLLPPGWTSREERAGTRNIVNFESAAAPDLIACTATMVPGTVTPAVLVAEVERSLGADGGTPWTARTSLGRCVGERFVAHPKGISEPVTPSGAVCGVQDGPVYVALVSLTVEPVEPGAAPKGCEAVLASIRNTSRP